ncbi:MAG: cobalt-precorrin-5B (C(1))-methyltransferase CbiD [Spirochaetia bacterium]|nr:cobalt-precorrin-5B (C(1))-methyltransferase CbiD [Spirochaetia bacterium]
MNERFGYTTGAYAAAAAKAAVLFLVHENDKSAAIFNDSINTEKKSVRLNLFNGTGVEIHFESIIKENNKAVCEVKKQSVEEADVTHNALIRAEVSLRDDNEIIIDGGQGVGRVTKPGLSLPKGEAAINTAPRKMIAENIRNVTSKGVDVIISVPEGERLANETTNERLGIIGGISILGTTGIMRPKSLGSFKRTILQRIKYLKENNIKFIAVAPGNIGEAALLENYKTKVNENMIVQSGDYLGFTMKKALENDLDFILAGHPGKLAKVLNNNFQTHFSRAQAANGAVIEFVKENLKPEQIDELQEMPTVEGICGSLIKWGHEKLISDLAEKISLCVKKYLSEKNHPPVILINNDKKIIGISEKGQAWAAKESR